MKYAVITDVHANVFALKAVLRDVDLKKPDRILCLGDIVGNGAYPEETVSLIRSRGDVECVKGNHDMFVNMDLGKINSADPRVRMFRWQQKVLSKASKDFLASLPNILIIKDGDIKIVAFHYPRNERKRFKDLIYLPDEGQVKELFRGLSGDVFLFGHEHTGSLTEADGKYYLNFGTCGNFLEKDSARYGMLTVEGGKVSYELCSARYDDSEARAKTEQINALLSE